MAWYQCTLLRTGPGEDGEVYIALKDEGGAFAWRWFQAKPQAKREMLAVALSAAATGLPLAVALPDPPNDYAQISALYVVRG